MRRRAPKTADPLKIGAVWVPANAVNYRVVDPLHALQRRGHEVVSPDAGGAGRVGDLVTCDVVHVYQRGDEPTRQMFRELQRYGVGIVWDIDDDYLNVPKDAPNYKKLGGMQAQHNFKAAVMTARMAGAMTTTSERLAEMYRQAGVQRVEVIPNALNHDVARPRRKHDGIVIGWIAAIEHAVDLKHIPLRQALRDLIDRHPDVRVECLGVDLGLPERYRHDLNVPFEELPSRIGGWDIGLAPLADIPFNRSRSDIKVKEYAASGVPWLASPVGPYVGLGEDQGGLLVADDGWPDALERLVTDRRLRKRLSKRAERWAASETVEAYADRWELLFAEVAAEARAKAAVAS